jgi:hypothetical protein
LEIGDASTATIDLLDTSCAPWGASADASMPSDPHLPFPADPDRCSRTWDTAAWLRLCTEAGVADVDMVQQVGVTGVGSFSGVALDCCLYPNYKGLAENIDAAAAAAESEISMGCISGYFAGPPILPCLKIPRNVAVRASDGKRRPTGDLGFGRDSAGKPGAQSWNANAPLDDPTVHPAPDYVTVKSVAHSVGVIAAIGVPYRVGKGDWWSFWRQLRKSPFEWWAQVYSVSSLGLILDFSVIFGDSAAPTFGNRIEAILVALIRHHFRQRLDGVQMAHATGPGMAAPALRGAAGVG